MLIPVQKPHSVGQIEAREMNILIQVQKDQAVSFQHPATWFVLLY